jgi:hypothetical protein
VRVVLDNDFVVLMEMATKCSQSDIFKYLARQPPRNIVEFGRQGPDPVGSCDATMNSHELLIENDGSLNFHVVIYRIGRSGLLRQWRRHLGPSSLNESLKFDKRPATKFDIVVAENEVVGIGLCGESNVAELIAAGRKRAPRIEDCLLGEIERHVFVVDQRVDRGIGRERELPQARSGALNEIDEFHRSSLSIFLGSISGSSEGPDKSPRPASSTPTTPTNRHCAPSAAMLRATLPATPITTSVRLVARPTAGASGEMRETSTIDKLVQHEIANAQHCLLAQFRQHSFEISDQTTQF